MIEVGIRCDDCGKLAPLAHTWEKGCFTKLRKALAKKRWGHRRSHSIDRCPECEAKRVAHVLDILIQLPRPAPKGRRRPAASDGDVS